MSTNDPKHTPGPWLKMRASGPAPRWTVEAPASGVRIAVDYGDGPAGHSEANMALVAAAPDLLAALERIAEDDPFSVGMPGRVARAAIAKARGEA